jgi:hypothetical protein
MNSFAKKLILMIVITVIISLQIAPLGISFVSPPKAQATLPTLTLGSIPEWILYYLNKVYAYMKDHMWPILRDLAAKKITDYITQQTLDYINNGTTPTFVGNWSQFANDAGNIAFDTVNNELTKNGVDLCSPFVPQLQLMLKGTFTQQPQVRCSVDNFKANIQNSLNLVQNGGWVSYTQAFMPDGNLLGMYVSYQDKIIGEAISKKAAKVNEAVSSGGFLGQKECSQYKDGTSADSIAQSCASNPIPYKDKETCINAVTEESCNSWNILTPGDTVGKAVANSITSDTTWGANIQSFTSAIVNALISKLFQKGLSSLKGSSATSDYSSTPDPSTVSQFNNIKQQMGVYYEDVIYYFNSSGYPTLNIWKDVQSLAQQGTTSCVPPDNWTTKYGQVTSVVDGVQGMLDEAQANLDDLNSIDPASLSAADLAQKVQDATDKYNSFQTIYQSLVSDVEQAKQIGDMTDNEKLAIAEKNNLTQSLSTAPNCGSTEVPAQ